MSVEVDLSEVDALVDDLVVAGPKARTASSVILTDTANELRAWAEAAAPRDTGELAGSIYVRGGEGWRIVGSDEEQGFFQEFGTSDFPPQPWLFGNGQRAGSRLAHRLGNLDDPV